MMGWIAQKTRGTRVTIGAVDYTNSLVNITLSDDSIIGSGVISCTGQMVLTATLGGPDLRDFTKTMFKRGTEVVIDVSLPDGTWVRHPRGLLYVISSSFNADQKLLELEVGCGLALRNLSDKIDDIKDLTALEIPEEQESLGALSAALYSEGKFIWMDNQGDINAADFFAGDGELSNKAPAQWVSVGGQTAISVQPLGVGTIPPDRIELGYRWKKPAGLGNDEDSETVESTYFLEHPAKWYAEVEVDGEATIEIVKRHYQVTAIQNSLKRYQGIGGQVSYEYQERLGPAVELQGQYFSDYFEKCRGPLDWFENRGDPNKGCLPGGLEKTRQSYSTRTYVYGDGGEVLKTVENQYRNVLACAVPSNWQPGARYIDGNVVTVDWREIPYGHDEGLDQFYLNQRTITSYEYYSDRTIQTTETWRSPCNCNSAGLEAGNIDATEGSKTIERRISRSKNANPPSPDRVNTGESFTIETGVLEDVRDRDSYLPGVTGAGPITMKQEVPADLPGPEGEIAEAIANTFLAYLRKTLEGDASGIRVVEALRGEILANYKPGMPFTYWDSVSEKAIKLRMNATSWALSRDEALVSTDGLFIGISNGTLNLPSNLVGGQNPLPPHDGGSAAPGTVPPVTPAIEGETAIDTGRTFNLVVRLGVVAKLNISGIGGTDEHIKAPPPVKTFSLGSKQRLMVYGSITTDAPLLATTASGGIPLESGGTLVTDSANVVSGDLFD